MILFRHMTDDNEAPTAVGAYSVEVNFPAWDNLEVMSLKMFPFIIILSNIFIILLQR